MKFLQMLSKRKKNNNIFGYIESFIDGEVKGWAFDSMSDELSLSVNVGGDEYILPRLPHSRSDVAREYGYRFINSGFTALLPEVVLEALKYLDDNDQLSFKVNGVEVKKSSDFTIESFAAKSIDDDNSENISLAEYVNHQKNVYPIDGMIFYDNLGGVCGYVHQIDCFEINGVISRYNGSDSLIVMSNQEEVSWDCFMTQPTYELGCSVADPVAFKILIPGYAFEGLDKAPLAISISSSVSEQSISLEVTNDNCAEWLKKIPNVLNSIECERLSLAAIEFLHFSDCTDILNSSDIGYYQQIIEKYSLNKYLDLKDTENKNEFDYEIDTNTKINWSCLRELNQRILEGEQAFDAISGIISRRSLRGKHLSVFCESVIPLLARTGELQLLTKFINFDQYKYLLDTDNAWSVSLAIAPLAVDRDVSSIIKGLYKLSSGTEGWINTECIRFSIKYILDLYKCGELEYSDVKEAVYAFIALLDSFEHEWFSRLHDKMLLDSTFQLMECRGMLSDYLLKDLYKAAIKNYGLVPEFWEGLTLIEGTIVPGNVIYRASQHWIVIRDFINELPKVEKNIALVLNSIMFFKNIGNKEATFLKREVIALLHFKGRYEDSVYDDCVSDIVRYSAYPSEYVYKHFEDFSEDVYEWLRTNTERKYSSLYSSQVNAGRSLLYGDISKVPFSSLNNWDAQFLSLDILAWNIVNQPDIFSKYLSEFYNGFLRLIAEAASNYFLPAPAYAAINTFMLANSDGTYSRLLDDLKILVCNKFGDRFDKYFENSQNNNTLGCDDVSFPMDTLVVIYSCKPYLSSRIKAIRESWLLDLKKYSVPYLIVVGDGDDRIYDDVLELNVSDKYEDLPKKTLKMFEWVFENTSAQYVMKIDDDCFLDVEEFISSLGYRKHHYYGRILSRDIGSMDRTWHQNKSKTLTASKSIDKSPEPSVYADGGGGYTLSRIAINELLFRATSHEGELLMAHSFMEDKLVGDLLAMSHIHPSDQDYHCYQRRRTFGKALPVAMRENIFYPSAVTPTLVTHLDTHETQIETKKIHSNNQLWPKKIWQSNSDVSIKDNSNQLELVSDLQRLELLEKDSVIVIAVFRNEIIMLPHFLSHYRSLGVKCFIIADNCSDDGSREYLFSQDDVILYSTDTEYKYSHYGVSWQQAILSNHCLGRWTLIADADELLVYPGCKEVPICEYINANSDNGQDAFRVDMIDMYPFDDLDDADFNSDDPFSVAPWHDINPLLEWSIGSGYYSSFSGSLSSLRHRLDKNAEPNAFTSQKYALIKYKPWMRFSEGIHDASGIKLSSKRLKFCHFKYHAGFKSKVLEEVQRGQHYAGAKEYKRYLSILEEGRGFFGDNSLSTKFEK